MNLLSIQSHVVYGHVGNAAVTFPLQRLGHTVWPLPTVVFSNHAGYPDVAGCAIDAPVLRDMLAALARRGVAAACDGVLSGYVGEAALAHVVAEAVDTVRAARPEALYCCDPVMGDSDGGLYVREGLPALFRDLLAPRADLLTPNLFELAVLADHDFDALAGGPPAGLAAAAGTLLSRHPRLRCVLVTSAAWDGLDEDRLAMVAVTRAGAWAVETPRIPFDAQPHGAGDLAAALFAVAWAETAADGSADPAAALETCGARLYAVLTVSARAGGGEMALAAAGEALADPPVRFAVRPIA